MSRFPNHGVEDAPAALRPLLQRIAQSSPTGLTVFTGYFLNYAQTDPDV